VRRRLQILLCLFAWFVATGCQWDFAQVVAWGRMFAGYSQEMSLSAAAEKTFGGEMCPICKAVQKGRQAQERNAATPSAAGRSEIKSPIASMQYGVVVFSPAAEIVGVIAPLAVTEGRGRSEPLVQPPRGRV
jgi:hypothetical protein